MQRKKVSYLRAFKGFKRRRRITYFRRWPPRPPKAYSVEEKNITNIGLRKYLTHRKGYKRIKGKTSVRVKLTVTDNKGRRIREIRGTHIGLSRSRHRWQEEIGSYVHGQLKEYSLYIGNYFTLAEARQFKYSKARRVTVALEFEAVKYERRKKKKKRRKRKRR